MIIRLFEEKDRPDVREIAWKTAFMGQPASVFFEDKEVLCDLLTRYFTDYEPQSSFVAESEGRVVGYVIGALDARHLKRVFILRMLLPLLLKALARGTFLTKKNILFLRGFLVSFFKGELSAPDFSGGYPATLHINLDDAQRRFGTGGALMAAFLELLREKKVAGVHMATMSEAGASFFKKQGFTAVYVGRRSYFRDALGRDISVSIFAKKIS